jgi:hypothetical protein
MQRLQQLHPIQSIKGEIKSGPEWIKRAALATIGLKPKTKEISDTSFLHCAIPNHSNMRMLSFWFECVVLESTMDHTVRHHSISPYVCTSRADIQHKNNVPDGYRQMAVCINSERLIQIMQKRLCNASKKETIEFFEMMKAESIRLEPRLKFVLHKPCVWHGFCIETRKPCRYFETKQCEIDRGNLIELATALKDGKQ